MAPDWPHGDVLLFLHVDSWLPADALTLIVTEFQKRPANTAGAFKLEIDSRHLFLKIAQATTNFRCSLFSNPYGDQAIFMSRALFEVVDGFTSLPLLEDVDIIRKIKRSGAKVKMLAPHVVTSARKWMSDGVFLRTMRNRLIMILYLFGAKPSWLVRFYR
jgi:hypothetical protein